MNDFLTWYYGLEFNLIPVPKGRKGAAIRWKAFETTEAPKISDDYDGNLAVVLGKTSGNLIDIDCDSTELFDLMQRILPETLTTRSFRGGHLYYRTDYAIRKFTLDLGAHGNLEVAGQGQISILPPSLHERGIIYKFVKKIPPESWPGDLRQELIELIESELKIRLKHERVNIERILQGVPEGQRDESAIRLATWYRKNGLTKDETLEKMLEWNQRNKPPLEEQAIEIKVESAWRPEEPYGYSFVEKARKEELSCGKDLADKIFEQANGEFLVFDKTTQKITKRKTIEGFKPFDKLVWTPIDVASPYESEHQLWSDIKQYIWEHIDIPEGYDILTAWVLASWIPEKWHAVPYLFFYGPAGSGKSWGLEVLASLGFRPFITAATTLAAIFRVTDEWHPTLFLDETGAYVRKERAEIMHLLNAGYRRGFPATRVEDTREGFKVRIFDCFGFKALAGTREFAKTLKSRCIIFNMTKATRKIKTTIDLERSKRLQSMLLMYRFSTLTKQADVESPDVLTGRLRELFDPLIIVAPVEARGSIIAEAKKIEQITTEEERTSDEAMVFKAVHEIHTTTKRGKITIEAIWKLVNESLGIDDQISNVSIGMTLSRLGFKRTLYEGKRAIFWNKELAERLKRRYLTPPTGDLTAFAEEDSEST